MIDNDFFAALNDLEKEKGIPKDIFLESLKNALVSACKRQYPGEYGDVEMDLDPETGTMTFYNIYHVVDEYTDEDFEITVEDAKEKYPDEDYMAGDEIRKVFVPSDFSRIAAQAAKQVIMQKIHETERDSLYSEYHGKEGQLLVGSIRKVDQKNVYLDIGKGQQIEGVMIPVDQVRSETYRIGSPLKVFIKKVKTGYKGNQVLVSRSAPGLVEKLFEEEVPEIKQGLVEIKSIAREPGERSKVAIYTSDPRVDAIGACVGNKGQRVNAISEELNGEKIDIIPWSENPLEYIASALSPAKVIMVSQLEGDKCALAVVPDDKLSLAIGKNGQNARLAVKLTGWKIDVKSRSMALSNGIELDEDDDFEE